MDNPSVAGTTRALLMGALLGGLIGLFAGIVPYLDEANNGLSGLFFIFFVIPQTALLALGIGAVIGGFLGLLLGWLWKLHLPH